MDESQQKLAQQIAYLESAIKPKLSRDALARYGSLRAAHPQKAVQALMLLAQYIDKIDIVTDEQFKDILQRMQPEQRQTTIIRK